jgi:hypothetical protein
MLPEAQELVEEDQHAATTFMMLVMNITLPLGIASAKAPTAKASST